MTDELLGRRSKVRVNLKKALKSFNETLIYFTELLAQVTSLTLLQQLVEVVGGILIRQEALGLWALAVDKLHDFEKLIVFTYGVLEGLVTFLFLLLEIGLARR